MKQAFAIFVLLAFVIQSNNRLLLMMDYSIRMENYAAHCENKDRPDVHCNGKCQLDKKLQQENRKDQQNPERKSENKNEYCDLHHIFSVPALTSFDSDNSPMHFRYSEGKELKRNVFVFHPPDSFV